MNIQNQFSNKQNPKIQNGFSKADLHLNLANVNPPHQSIGQGLTDAIDSDSADLSGESSMSSLQPNNGSPIPTALNINTKKSNIIQKDKNLSISLEKLVKNNERRQMN